MKTSNYISSVKSELYAGGIIIVLTFINVFSDSFSYLVPLIVIISLFICIFPKVATTYIIKDNQHRSQQVIAAFTFVVYFLVAIIVVDYQDENVFVYFLTFLFTTACYNLFLWIVLVNQKK